MPCSGWCAASGGGATDDAKHFTREVFQNEAGCILQKSDLGSARLVSQRNHDYSLGDPATAELRHATKSLPKSGLVQWDTLFHLSNMLGY